MHVCKAAISHWRASVGRCILSLLFFREKRLIAQAAHLIYACCLLHIALVAVVKAVVAIQIGIEPIGLLSTIEFVRFQFGNRSRLNATHTIHYIIAVIGNFEPKTPNSTVKQVHEKFLRAFDAAGGRTKKFN